MNGWTEVPEAFRCTSFPRKRESSFPVKLTAAWIPAFAGMTFGDPELEPVHRYFPNTVLSKSVTLAAGSVRILRSSSANTKKRPARALSTT